MKKWIIATLVLACVTDLMGCASVQKKFTRKKKEAKHTPTTMYVDEGPYQKKYSNDYYYRTHYTLWRTWHDELISDFGGNSKKTNRSAEECVNHLEQMVKYLNPQKGSELRKRIEDLQKALEKMDGGLNDSSSGTVRVELDRIRRLISYDYHYDKVKEDLVVDTVDLGVPAA